MIFYLIGLIFFQNFFTNEALTISKIKQINEISEVNKLAVLPGSDALACSFSDISFGIRIWGVSNTSFIRSIAINGHNKSISSLLGLPNGRLASASEDGTLKIWNYFSGILIANIFSSYSNDFVSTMILLPNGNLYSAWAQEIKIYNPVDGKLINSNWADNSISAFAYLQKGYFASASYDHYNIKLWNSTTLKLASALSGHSNYVAQLMEMTSGYLVSYSKDLTFKTWDPVRGTVIKTFTGQKDWPKTTVQLKNGHFAVGSGNGNLYIWISSTGSLALQSYVHANSINSLVTLPNGDLVSGSTDKTIKFWNTGLL